MKKGIFSGRWTAEEHSKFLQGISFPNYCWEAVSQLVGTRSAAQCRSHYQKHNKSKQVKPRPSSQTKNPKSLEKISKEIQCNSTEESSSSPDDSPILHQIPFAATPEHQPFFELYPSEDSFELFNF